MTKRTRGLLDEDEVQFLSERTFSSKKRTRNGSTPTLRGSSSPNPSSPDLDSVSSEIIDLTANLRTTGSSSVLRDELALEVLRVTNTIVQAGVFLQVEPFAVGEYEAEFLQVRVIVRSVSTGMTKIRGIPFARNSSMLGKLPKKTGDVCMILYYGDGNSLGREGLVDVDPSGIVGQRTLILTNALYPMFKASSWDQPDKLEVRFNVCRNMKKKTEETFARIRSNEVPIARYRVSEEVLRNQWRGTRMKGGSWIPILHQHQRTDIINLDEETEDISTRMSGQKYTVFDACSGAGGVSRGAQMAGFKIQYAVDKAPEVWETYAANFPNTEQFRMSLDELISTHSNRYMRADVLHFSPPCQFFSPAHTWASEHDDTNIFALFSGNQLLKKVRPRVVTVEQTFGLTHDRHAEYFCGFLGDFTQHGYSVRWKVVRLCTWGAAQDRKRLIVIAAAPGEGLPPFPEATHSMDGETGLMPFNTIRNALNGVRAGDSLHDVGNARRFQPPRRPLDADRLAGTITTGGGDVYFPDGSRELTLREWASLQGFPRNHIFHGTKTSIKKQIGNAFPPNTVRVLYRHIREWLLKEDQIQTTSSRDLILIDDESDASTFSNGLETHDGSPEMDEELMEVVAGHAGRPIQLDDEDDCTMIDLT
ncbi:S-adenosyl-L-methionine-dependent methyltransferase [Thelonectria olida]|uniref:DNA (cytosine-5-)-methyltransferase n=1 Tax=Thelonectria olida TaxID=1576542 RepID=A0A9P8W1X1_9HYPO|nr:S-adenosyl-L-methionine-dependent methyltransferase [Thelonectria olida]